MRVRREERVQHSIECLAACVESAYLKLSSRRYDFEGRVDACDVPAGMSARVFVAGGEIDSLLGIESFQQRVQSLFVRDIRAGALD
jgi:hypothetical protein